MSNSGCTCRKRRSASGESHELSKQKYAIELSKQQGRLNRLSRHKTFGDGGVVAVFEGPDAAGKGGAIRRITAALDARYYQVVPIAAQSDEERKDTIYKRYKLTPDDWRNRKKWNAYQIAAGDMIERTSTVLAPWTLVEASDKRNARIKVLKTLCDRMKAAID